MTKLTDSDYYMMEHYKKERELDIKKERNKIAENKLYSDQEEARANRNLSYQVEKMKEEGRIKREQVKMEKEAIEKNVQAMTSLAKAGIDARKEIELSQQEFYQKLFLNEQEAEIKRRELDNVAYYEKINTIISIKKEKMFKKMEYKQDSYVQEQNHNQERFLQAREIESQHTMQANQLTYELERQKQDHSQEKYLQNKTQEHEIDQLVLRYAHEQYTKEREYQHELDLKEEDRITYAHNAAIDTKAYVIRSQTDTYAYQKRGEFDTIEHQKRSIINLKEKEGLTRLEIMAYNEKTKADKDKKTNESIAYAFERTIDAKLKVWIMEQEKRIFGNKQTDEEINEHIKRNREKWDKEI